MRLIMIEILIMSFGGFLFNPHYLHTLMHDVIKTHYEPPKFIICISVIMSLLRPLTLPKKARPPFDGDASLVVAEGLARAWGASCGHLQPKCYDRVLSLSNNQRCLLRPGPDPNPGT